MNKLTGYGGLIILAGAVTAPFLGTLSLIIFLVGVVIYILGLKRR